MGGPSPPRRNRVGGLLRSDRSPPLSGGKQMLTEHVPGVVDSEVLERTAGRFREAGIALPRFAELAEPTLVPERIRERLASVGPDEKHPLNLYRVHWFNDAARTGL